MIKFKTPRLRQEWDELEKRNPRLHRIVSELNTHCETEFIQPITITCIYRSEAENAALYAPKAQPNRRPHTQWEAVDLRSRDWTPERTASMLAVLNAIQVYAGTRKCGVVHSVPGNVDHFHINAPAVELSPKPNS